MAEVRKRSISDSTDFRSGSGCPPLGYSLLIDFVYARFLYTVRSFLMPTIRRTELIALSTLALLSLLTAWALLSWYPTGLVGRYWDNVTWTGTCIAESATSVPTAADFLQHVPAAAHAAASAEWTGFLRVDHAGPHRFDLMANEGAWLYVDDVLVIYNDGTHGRRFASGRVTLAPGHHRLRVRCFESGGGVALELRWTQPGGRTDRLRADDLAPFEPGANRQRLRPLVPGLSVAIPVIWGCLFLYVPVRLAGWWMWREVERAAPRVEDRRSLVVVLCIACGLMVWGFEWGLVGDGWAPDEILPELVRDALQRGFSGGWYDKYPLLHYAVLAIPVSAFELASRYAILAADSLTSNVAQLALMRVVSVLMGLGALLAAFLCGAELHGPRRAVFGALAMLLTPLFLFYGKTANLDIPMLCWFGWALVAFLRILRLNRRGDYVLLGIAAAGAVATKDQAYANLALLPFAVIIANARHQPSPLWWRRLGAAIVDSRVLAAGAAAALASGLFHNVLFNFGGFVSHFRLLSTLGDLSTVPRTAASYFELSGTTLMLFRFAFGWPLVAMAAVGIAGAALRSDRRWWLWLLLVPLSFHLTFTWVTLYVNDRYLLGGAFVLALFAGAALADLLDARRWRRAAWFAVAGSIAYSLLYAASINVMMNVDARHAARRWVYAHAGPDTTVGRVGDYLPYLDAPVRVIGFMGSVDDVRGAKPGLIIVNARFAQRFAAERLPARRDMTRGLEDGSLGYAEVFRARAPVPAWALLQYETPFRRAGESLLTNLDKVNPEMAIYQRIDK